VSGLPDLTRAADRAFLASGGRIFLIPADDAPLGPGDLAPWCRAEIRIAGAPGVFRSIGSAVSWLDGQSERLEAISRHPSAPRWPDTENTTT
jgi:hypothetical protein